MPVRKSTAMGMAAGFILAAAAGFWGVFAYGLRPNMPNGVTFGGVPVGGQTYAAASNLLNEHIRAAEGWTIAYQSDKPEASAAGTFLSAGFRWDPSAPTQAIELLQQGNPLQRAWNRLQLRGRDVPMGLLYDGDTYEAFIRQNWSALHAQQPVVAKRTISDQDQVSIIPDIPVYRVNSQELLNRLQAVDWRRLWRESKAAVGKNGAALPVPIDLPLVEARSQITYESLASQGIERKISEFTTAILPGGEGRYHNISSAARTVQDRLLAPGEIFDYAPVIKETETRFGFREAPVIYNGKLVPGVGGGICQVSSTLYNAVIRAGLEIVERRNHTLPVSYVPLGQDATFSEGYINFRFRNTTGAYLLIRTETQKDKLTIKLFGRLDQSVTYAIESVTIAELEAPVKTVVNPALPAGKKETLQKGKPGYVVETYRIKKQNDTILSKELLSKDRYQPQPHLIAIGGKSEPDTVPPAPGSPDVVEDGVEGPRFR